MPSDPGAAAREAEQKVRAAMDRLAAELEDRRDDLADTYARWTLERARTNAGGRPTPQARMAASGLEVGAGGVLGDPGTVVHGRGGSATLADVGGGSEFGSTIYPQFGPRQGRGAWLAPAVDDAPEGARPEAERLLDDAIKAAIRGIG